MRKFQILLASVVLAAFAMGCGDDTGKKSEPPPSPKTDLGAPANPPSSTSTPAPKTSPTK